IGWGIGGVLSALPVLAGAVLIFAGLRLAYGTMSLFGTKGEGTLAPWDPTRKLVVLGPYRRVRNPMITGVCMILLGEGGLVGSTATRRDFATSALANALWPPLREGPGRVRRFGDEYVEYRRAVPRWTPRRTPWTPRG